jgi:hypothetical protein
MLLVYTGTAWLADACEMILLSYIGPAVRHLLPVIKLHRFFDALERWETTNIDVDLAFLKSHAVAFLTQKF